MLPVGDDDLFCDASRVRQVLSNLVGNAVKFTDQGEVKVTVGLTPQESHTELRIQVADTGRGIDKAAQNALFRPFEQAVCRITLAPDWACLSVRRLPA
jgi:multi-sensor hybrid histidine kinase (EC 2.7.13.3)